jgi:hypothetical protein
VSKLAILFTAFERKNLSEKTLQSIYPYLSSPNIFLLVADQSKIPYSTTYGVTNSFVYTLPYDCGLSAARNFLVQQAFKLDCEFVLLTADSIEFNSGYDFRPYIDFLKSNPTYGILGFNLINKREWEFNMNIVDNCFELTKSNECVQYNNRRFKKIDICRNFFLAKTQTLLDCKWDENLKLCEHEAFFWDLKTRTDWKVFYTDSLSASYIKQKEGEYKKLRLRSNFEYAQLAKIKYGLKQLVRVKN